MLEQVTLSKKSISEMNTSIGEHHCDINIHSIRIAQMEPKIEALGLEKQDKITA